MKRKLILLAITALLCVGLTNACHAITLSYLGSFSLNGSNANEVVVVGNYAYVATSSNTFSVPGLYIVNLANTSVIKVCQIPGAVDVCVQGNYAYVACTDGMVIVDIDLSDNTNPKALSNSYAPTPSVLGAKRSVQRICVSGNYAYLQCAETPPPPSAPTVNYYYEIVNIANPFTPELVGSRKSSVSNTSYKGYGITAYGDTVYAADTFLSLFNVANPANPLLTTGDSMGRFGSDVFVNDSYLYNVNIESTASKLQIRSHLGALLGWCAITNVTSASRLSVSGKYAYVSKLSNGISVVDISNPASPSIETTFSRLGTTAYGVFAAGNYVYVADGTAGLSIFSITGQSTSVDLKVEPVSPRYTGTPITLLASGYPGKDARYEFRAGANVIRAYGTSAKYVWTPNAPRSYGLTVAAKDFDGVVTTSTVTTYSVFSHVSNVSLSANPASPQPVGTPITLTATATGGDGVTYDFYDGATMLSRLDDTSPTYNWTPGTEGLHELKVYATDSGGTSVVSAALNYTVGTSLSSVGLSADLTSPQLVGTQLTLTATAVGGSGVQYKFMNGLEMLRDFSAANTFNYTMASAKNYQLKVIAKDASGITVESAALSFNAISTIQSVSIAANPVSPQLLGTQVTLTATAVGGTGLQYKFLAGGTYVLRDFSSSNTMNWTFATAGTKQLSVVAKDSTGKTVTAQMNYTILPFSVGLAVSPASPQAIGTPVTLTATAVGGTSLQYKFLAGTYVLRDFAASNAYTHKFANVTTQKLTVVAKDISGKTVTSPIVNFTVVAPVQSASLTITPASPALAGTKLTLTAGSVGGVGLQYKFIANGTYVMRDYSPTKTMEWTFTTPGTRPIYVVAKDSTGKTVSSNIINYTVLPSVQSVSLKASPNSPQLTRTEITLTATAIGGEGIQYKFIANGTYVLRDYSTSSTLKWTFSTPGTRPIYVLAKDVNNKVVKSQVLYYTIQ